MPASSQAHFRLAPTQERGDLTSAWATFGTLSRVGDWKHGRRCELDLARLVAEWPEVHALAAGLRVAREQLRAVRRRADAELVAQRIWIASEHRGQDLSQHAIGVAGVFADPGPHRRERVREPIAILAAGVKLLGQRLLRRFETVGRRVVRGCEPSVAETRDAPKTGG